MQKFLLKSPVPSMLFLTNESNKGLFLPANFEKTESLTTKRNY